MKDHTLAFLKPDSPGFIWLAQALGPRKKRLQLSDALWPAIAPLLEPHRVTGLLFEQIQNGSIEASRSIQFDLVARLTRWSAATRDWPELANLALGELSRREIPLLVLKGWALIPLVYQGRREWREVSDLDLLIPPAYRAKAHAALGAAGFTIPPQADVWPGFAHKFSHEAQYIRRCEPRRPLGIDLHWQVMGSPHLWPLVGGDWFERAQSVALDGQVIRIPATEDLFLHLCGHEVIDHARAPIPLLFRRVDLLQLTRMPGFSWSVLVERACTTALTASLKTSVESLYKLWPESIPSGALHDCRHLEVSPAETSALKSYLARTSPFRPSPGLRWISGGGARIQYLFGKLFPSPAFLRAVHHLPPDASYLRGLFARYASRLSD